MTTRASALALTPLLLFLALFFGAGLYFTAQGEPMGFYQLRAPVAILPALALAVWIAHRKGLKALEVMLQGMGDPNIVLMCLIYLLAGAFAYVSSAVGAVDAVVALGLGALSPALVLPGLFVLGYDFYSGLTFANARYFDPTVGRFISEDTYEGRIENPITLNLYTYAHNNPIIYRDPTGHWIDTIIDVGFILYDIGKIVVNPTNPTNWYALGADIVGALTPGGTGFGMAVRGLDNAKDLAKSLSKLSKQERIDALRNGKIVMPYKQLKKISKGTGLEAHHLIEKRFKKQLGVKENDILSVAIDKTTHSKITEKFREYLPYDGTKGATVTTKNAKPQDIWNATKKVYEDIM